MRRTTLKKMLCTQGFEIKTALKNNKRLLILSFGCCAFGMILCLFSLSGYVQNHSVKSTIEKIGSGEFSVVLFEIKIVTYLILPMLLCFLLSVNIYLLYVTFPMLAIGSFYFFRYVFACMVSHFFYGLLSFLLILLPVFILIVIGLTFFFRKLFEIVSLPSCKKHILQFVAYGTYFRQTKKEILSYLLFFSLPCFIYVNLILVITYLICNA